MSFSFNAIKEPYLDDLVREHIIFIDLSSLMNENFQKLAYKLEPILIKNKKKLIILKSILNRLSKEALDFSKKCPNIPNTSNNTLKIINILHRKNLIEFKAESSKVIGKYDFISKFHDLRDKHKLLLITEDYDLAKEILNLNNLTITKGYKIIVKEINDLGYLENIDLTYLKVPNKEKFKLKTKVNNTKSQKLNITSIPSEGNFVVCDGKVIKLLNFLAGGGEGDVYSTETQYVCKIYKKEKLESKKLEKLKLMISKKISCDGICWPIDLVYNVHNEFVGYLMPKAEGIELQKSVFSPSSISSSFPKWRRRDMVNLCITILEKIQFLHDRNIILGDINPFNILVVNPKKVYFVDVDSYQVEGFPCPVGNSNYTAPEIQKKSCSDFLRTFQNEYFTISALLFMIMLLGKHPYSRKGGGTPIENIKEMNFTYPLDGVSYENVPNGNWKYIWSHMPYFIQEAFYTTFKKGYKNNLEKNRFTTREWREKMEKYLDLLVSEKLTTKDSMVDAVFPNK